MARNGIGAFFFAAIVVLAAAAQQPACCAKGGVPPAADLRAPAGTMPTLTAMREAAEAEKYIFLFFYRTTDESTRAARGSFDRALEKLADRAASAAVNISDPQERDLVTKYQLERSPMPLVLAIAPAGAVTRSFVGEVTEAQLESAFVSPGMQKCLKALQDRKLAFLCVQNGSTQHNAEAMQGVRDFVADPRYQETTEIITVDPTDPAEAGLLRQFKVDPQTAEAVTVFLAPPGTTVGRYTGATTKAALRAAATTAAKGCDPKSGCCGPRNAAGSPAPPPGGARPGANPKR